MNVTELLDSLTGASQPPTLAEMIRAYLIATAGLGVTCFVAGMLPRLISFQIRSSRSLILSFCLCCGAGVLLATAMVHILPEISEKIPNLAAVVFCAGFLMLFFIDEMVHFWCSSKNGDYEDMDPLLNGTSHHHYGAIPRPIENDLNFSSEESDGSASSSRASHNSPSTTKRKAEKRSSLQLLLQALAPAQMIIYQVTVIPGLLAVKLHYLLRYPYTHYWKGQLLACSMSP